MFTKQNKKVDFITLPSVTSNGRSGVEWYNFLKIGYNIDEKVRAILTSDVFIPTNGVVYEPVVLFCKQKEAKRHARLLKLRTPPVELGPLLRFGLTDDQIEDLFIGPQGRMINTKMRELLVLHKPVNEKYIVVRGPRLVPSGNGPMPDYTFTPPYPEWPSWGETEVDRNTIKTDDLGHYSDDSFEPARGYVFIR